MEKELLRLYARHEATVDETAGPRRKFKLGETGEGFLGEHHRRSLALELDLTQQARNLHGVDGGTLSPGVHHQLEVVLGEFRKEARRQARPEEEHKI